MKRMRRNYLPNLTVKPTSLHCKITSFVLSRMKSQQTSNKTLKTLATFPSALACPTSRDSKSLIKIRRFNLPMFHHLPCFLAHFKFPERIFLTPAAL